MWLGMGMKGKNRGKKIFQIQYYFDCLKEMGIISKNKILKKL